MWRCACKKEKENNTRTRGKLKVRFIIFIRLFGKLEFYNSNKDQLHSFQLSWWERTKRRQDCSLFSNIELIAKLINNWQERRPKQTKKGLQPTWPKDYFITRDLIFIHSFTTIISRTQLSGGAIVQPEPIHTNLPFQLEKFTTLTKVFQQLLNSFNID